jgi:hypothetical protein
VREGADITTRNEQAVSTVREEGNAPGENIRRRDDAVLDSDIGDAITIDIEGKLTMLRNGKAPSFHTRINYFRSGRGDEPEKNRHAKEQTPNLHAGEL